MRKSAPRCSTAMSPSLDSFTYSTVDAAQPQFAWMARPNSVISTVSASKSDGAASETAVTNSAGSVAPSPT
jgi:hypothetical protein